MTTEAAAPADAGNTASTAAPATAGDQPTAAPVAEQAPAPTEPVAEAPKTEPDAPAEAEPPAAKAPEKYDFKAPEGTDLAPEVIGKFEALAREMDMTQEQAQKFVSEVAPEMVKAQEAAKTKLVTEWTEAAKADKEFGGEKLNENLAIAKQALDTFGTPELRDMLNKTGLGNNPELIRAFYRAGKQISQSTFVQGNSAPQTQSQGAASKLYPDMN